MRNRAIFCHLDGSYPHSEGRLSIQNLILYTRRAFRNPKPPKTIVTCINMGQTPNKLDWNRFRNNHFGWKSPIWHQNRQSGDLWTKVTKFGLKPFVWTQGTKIQEIINIGLCICDSIRNGHSLVENNVPFQIFNSVGVKNLWIHSIFWPFYLLVMLSTGHSIFWSFYLLVILSPGNSSLHKLVLFCQK